MKRESKERANKTYCLSLSLISWMTKQCLEILCCKSDFFDNKVALAFHQAAKFVFIDHSIAFLFDLDGLIFLYYFVFVVPFRFILFYLSPTKNSPR